MVAQPLAKQTVNTEEYLHKPMTEAPRHLWTRFFFRMSTYLHNCPLHNRACAAADGCTRPIGNFRKTSDDPISDHGGLKREALA